MKVSTANKRLKMLEEFNRLTNQEAMNYEDAYKHIASEMNRPLRSVAEDIRHAKRNLKTYKKLINHSHKV